MFCSRSLYFCLVPFSIIFHWKFSGPGCEKNFHKQNIRLAMPFYVLPWFLSHVSSFILLTALKTIVIQIYDFFKILLLVYSYVGDYSSKVGTNHFLNWCVWLIVSGPNISTRPGNSDIWPKWNGPILLETLERFSYYLPGLTERCFWNVHKFFGTHAIRFMIN